MSVFVCVCLCCLELLNTLCFTIIRLEIALLLAYIKSASFFFFFFFSAQHFSGRDFHSTQTTTINSQSNQCILLLASTFLGAKPVNKNKGLQENCKKYMFSTCFKPSYLTSLLSLDLLLSLHLTLE